MKTAFCHKHQMSENDERWKTAFQELVSGEDERIEPFHLQVCPMCYLSLREKNKKNKWQLRAESAKSIRLQSEVSRLQRVVDAVASVVKEATGTDPFSLVGKCFPRPCRGGAPGIVDQEEVGKLERILPNLIVEAIKAQKHQM
jgi:hypothetical protein